MPVSYNIVSGKFLIWDRFGIKFEKLYYLSVTPIVFCWFRMKGNLKKTMFVVVLSVLTLAAFSMLVCQNVRADNSEAKILSYSWYVAPSNTVLAEYVGDLVAVGEVQNVGSNVIRALDVIGVAYNATGEVLDSNEVQVFGNNLLPGQIAPFYIDFIPEYSVTQDQSWISSVSNVTVEVGFVIDSNVTQNSGLTISSSTHYIDSSGAFTVTGTIQNSGTEAAGYVSAVTTFYNASGVVVGLNFTDYLTSSLAPGGYVPFTATPTDNTVQLSNGIANYSLLIQSQPVTTSATPIPSLSPSEQPTSSPTASPPVTEQSLDSQVLIYVIVGIVVIAVVAFALFFLRKRRNLPLPPPPPPKEQVANLST
jgi:hypothetical protein